MADSLDLAPIEARLKAATPGPWRWVAVSGGWDGVAAEGGPDICRLSLNLGANAILIAHAPTDIAALVAEVRRLQDESGQLREELTIAENARDRLAADRTASLLAARVDGARAMLVRVRGIASSIDLAAGAGELSDTINGAICALDPATVAVFDGAWIASYRRELRWHGGAPHPPRSRRRGRGVAPRVQREQG